MGREIRKVPANWQHPKNDIGRYTPLFDQNLEEAVEEWNKGRDLWDKGMHEAQTREKPTSCESYEEWAGSEPTAEAYRQYEDEDCIWFQVYETVSKGTPVTPAFPTMQEVEDWLVEHGELEGTKYNRKFSRSAAHAFCRDGYAPTMVINNGSIHVGIESCDK